MLATVVRKGPAGRLTSRAAALAGMGRGVLVGITAKRTRPPATATPGTTHHGKAATLASDCIATSCAPRQSDSAAPQSLAYTHPREEPMGIEDRDWYREAVRERLNREYRAGWVSRPLAPPPPPPSPPRPPSRPSLAPDSSGAVSFWIDRFTQRHSWTFWNSLFYGWAAEGCYRFLRRLVDLLFLVF